MREPPVDLTDSDVLRAVHAEWDGLVDEVEHLPIGFGAHHWRASAAGEPRLFVTFDRLLPKRDADELERAYAAAAGLAASGLDFVLASRQSRLGSYTVPLGNGALSVAPWTDGSTGDGVPADEAEATAVADMLSRLHATQAPEEIPRWRPLVDPSHFAVHIGALLEQPWDTGPYGDVARAAVAASVVDIDHWSTEYGERCRDALDVSAQWVPTHGEPDTGNQLVTHSRRWLVDWESLKLSPRERDLLALVGSGRPWQHAYPSSVDWRMVEMFDLEWRLDEINQYATWFSEPHTGSASDAVAFAGLLKELGRQARRTP